MKDSRGISRRTLIGAVGGIGVSSVLGAASVAQAAGAPRSASLDTTGAHLPGAHGALGANFNQLFANIQVRELELGQAQWVRGFFPMPEADKVDPANHVTIRTARSIRSQGYQTVMNLKFPYNQSAIPAPNTPEMELALARVDKVLPAVMGVVDILVIGNEPFIESRPEDRGDALNTFYETVTARIIAYREAHGGDASGTRLYLGALNRLDLPDRQTAATERWMTFVRQTPELAGVDIHPHVPSPEAVQPFLDYILPRLRSDQTFLATEFSLVWYWQAHLLDPVEKEFTARYGFPSDSLVWEVILAATQTPFPQEQWNTFLSLSPWYEQQKYFLRDQVQKFRATGRLAVACCDYRQGLPMSQNFLPDKPPWVLNCVFAPYTVRPWPNGTTGRGYHWIDQFKALQQ